MACNFNNPYPFGWSAANPFIPPAATPAPPPGFNLTPALSDQQCLTGGSVTPVFNSNVLLHQMLHSVEAICSHMD